MKLRLGTRRSLLATTQSRGVARQLEALGHDVELVEITTEGDSSPELLTAIGGTGVFASALRVALRSGQIDLAVHSLKDLPTALEPELVLGAITRREDPRDALIARDGLTLGELPTGATIGTGSPRRAAQLAELGLGLTIEPIRGNVDTRISYVESGALDGVVLARAGLARLGRTSEITEVLDPIQMLPAAGQGALAVECREDRADVREILSAIHDADTAACVNAERALLATLEAGCTAPIGALAEIVDDGDVEAISLRAFVADPEGGAVRRSAVGPLEDPTAVGVALAADILAELPGLRLIASESQRPPALVPQEVSALSGDTYAGATSTRSELHSEPHS